MRCPGISVVHTPFLTYPTYEKDSFGKKVHYFKSSWLRWPVIALVIACIGCGGGNGPVASPTPPSQPLTVTQQPVSQAVKLGDTATFSVVVTGTGSVTYQWQKNGTPINGATSSSYTTPPTTVADNDSVFNVVVIGPGSVVLPTNKARLVLNPPKPGDLRFQEVDAPATLNNYNLSLLSNIDGGVTTTWTGYGSPLVFSAFGQCAGGTNPLSCAWGFLGFSGSSGLTTKYQGGLLSNFPSDLAALGAGEVVASLDFESFNNAYAMSRVKSSSGGSFTPVVSQSVLPADFQAMASQEGALSHVITGVTAANSMITFVSHGWQNDTSTVYEVQVLSATLSTIPNQAATLAQNGFFITAFGGNQLNGFFLVGTRVQGQTIPRPFANVNSGLSNATDLVFGQGFALVVDIENTDGTHTWLGEK